MNSLIKMSDSEDNIRTADERYYSTLLPPTEVYNAHTISENDQIEELLRTSREEYEMQQIMEQISQIEENYKRLDDDLKVQMKIKEDEKIRRHNMIEPIMRFWVHATIKNRVDIHTAIDAYRNMDSHHIWLSEPDYCEFVNFIETIEKRIGNLTAEQIKNACSLISADIIEDDSGLYT